MAEKLCSWTRDDVKAKRKKLEKIVGAPRYLCVRCARAAASKKHLCKPERIG